VIIRSISTAANITPGPLLIRSIKALNVSNANKTVTRTELTPNIFKKM